MSAYDHGTRATMQSVIGAMFLGVFLGIVLVFAVQHDFKPDNIVKHDNVSQGDWETIMHACTPRYMGGGAMMCANPTTYDLALVACFDNRKAYVGATMRQCVDDFIDMKGWR